jgi:cytochrome c biogenesis protein CcdA
VYCTYLLFGLALAFGPAAALRSGLADTPSIFGPTIEVVVGGLLVSIGIRTWRRRASGATSGTPETHSHPGSAFALGVLTTLADLPTAAPLLVATALIAGTNAKPWAAVGDLALYNIVYISPLLVVGLAYGSAARAADSGRRSRTLLACAPVVVAGLCVAGGAIVGCEGVAALV